MMVSVDLIPVRSPPLFEDVMSPLVLSNVAVALLPIRMVSAAPPVFTVIGALAATLRMTMVSRLVLPLTDTAAAVMMPSRSISPSTPESLPPTSPASIALTLASMLAPAAITMLSPALVVTEPCNAVIEELAPSTISLPNGGVLPSVVLTMMSPVVEITVPTPIVPETSVTSIPVCAEAFSDPGLAPGLIRSGSLVDPTAPVPALKLMTGPVTLTGTVVSASRIEPVALRFTETAVELMAPTLRSPVWLIQIPSPALASMRVDLVGIGAADVPMKPSGADMSSVVDSIRPNFTPLLAARMLPSAVAMVTGPSELRMASLSVMFSGASVVVLVMVMTV